MKRVLARKLDFLAFARLHFISALDGPRARPAAEVGGRGLCRGDGAAAHPAAHPRAGAGGQQQAPPRAGSSRPKLRYAHQGGVNPPRIVIHGNALDHVPETYRRYLERFFRDAFKLQGTPLRVEFRSGANPYAQAHRRTTVTLWRNGEKASRVTFPKNTITTRRT